jgi:hypothetical protein
MNSKKGKRGLEKIKKLIKVEIKQKTKINPFEKKLLNKVDKAIKVVLKEDKFEEPKEPLKAELGYLGYPLSPCKYCIGYGFWPLGDLVPIGEWDSRDWGAKVVQCPYCKNPYNGQTSGERYESLKKYKEEHERIEREKLEKEKQEK